MAKIQGGATLLSALLHKNVQATKLINSYPGSPIMSHRKTICEHQEQEQAEQDATEFLLQSIDPLMDNLRIIITAYNLSELHL